ncbi:hypothetical protein F441_16274, partial [Phytophthora nicotianae CJ01A1]
RSSPRRLQPQDQPIQLPAPYIMGMNEFGEGAVVQQSLIEANGDWHMERAITHFKRSHPTRINLLRVIVVDKDLNEIRVLERISQKPGS